MILDAQKIIHLGATSCFVTDNCELIQVCARYLTSSAYGYALRRRVSVDVWWPVDALNFTVAYLFLTLFLSFPLSLFLSLSLSRFSDERESALAESTFASTHPPAGSLCGSVQGTAHFGIHPLSTRPADHVRTAPLASSRPSTLFLSVFGSASVSPL